MGKKDLNGNLHVLGRSDEIIISGGENISLVEIEKKLNEKTFFGNCVAISIKDKKWSESYIIVSDSSEKNIEMKIQKFMEENFARYKHPQNIFVTAVIPRDALGKVQKYKLKKIIMLD